jgi:hypothetical protein
MGPIIEHFEKASANFKKGFANAGWLSPGAKAPLFRGLFWHD